MKNIFTSGIISEYNFGGPSILHGINELLKTLYNNDYHLINYQKTKVIDTFISDLDFPIVQNPNTYKSTFKKHLKTRLFGRFSKNDDRMIADIKNSDVAIDLYGICFCDNLRKENYSAPKVILNVISIFLPIYIAKYYGVRTVKNIASFGPMRNATNIRSAQYAMKNIFDIAIAREEQSKDALQNEGKIGKEIFVSPDIANLMRGEKIHNAPPRIGISVSYQITKQWESEDSYIDCIVELCQHIATSYQLPIILIPNEFLPSLKYNDIHISDEIKKLLEEKEVQVEILDVLNMNSSMIKNEIASCSALIASRYHSCVAGLSSGIPTFVIGWHYKYIQLLQWYQQEQWILSHKSCTKQTLISQFELFWAQKETSSKIIKNNYPKVREQIIKAGKLMLNYEEN